MRIERIETKILIGSTIGMTDRPMVPATSEQAWLVTPGKLNLFTNKRRRIQQRLELHAFSPLPSAARFFTA